MCLQYKGESDDMRDLDRRQLMMKDFLANRALREPALVILEYLVIVNVFLHSGAQIVYFNCVVLHLGIHCRFLLCYSNFHGFYCNQAFLCSLTYAIILRRGHSNAYTRSFRIYIVDVGKGADHFLQLSNAF